MRKSTAWIFFLACDDSELYKFDRPIKKCKSNAVYYIFFNQFPQLCVSVACLANIFRLPTISRANIFQRPNIDDAWEKEAQWWRPECANAP